MSYKRFLRNVDYKGAISEYHLEQISDGYDPVKFEQAESDSEICFIEYLTDNYSVEDAFNIGKKMLDYNSSVTYPIGVYFWKDEKPYKVIKKIYGSQKPEISPYWELFTDEVTELLTVQAYTQTGDYYTDDLVEYIGGYYKCVKDNGMSFNDIRVPGVINLWTKSLEPAASEYSESTLDYEAGDVVSYKGENFLATDVMVNGTQPEIYTNVISEDPRNPNIRKHMVRLSLYEMCKAVSPNNMSQTIHDDWEYSMQWLHKCNRLTISPTIARRKDENGEQTNDWAIGVFGDEYDRWYI